MYAWQTGKYTWHVSKHYHCIEEDFFLKERSSKLKMKIRSYFHKREKNVLRMWTGRAETMTAKEGLKWCWQNMLEIRFFQFFLVMRKYLITTKCSTSIEKNPIHPRFWTVKISKFHIDQNIPLYSISIIQGF